MTRGAPLGIRYPICWFAPEISLTAKQNKEKKNEEIYMDHMSVDTKGWYDGADDVYTGANDVNVIDD